MFSLQNLVRENNGFSNCKVIYFGKLNLPVACSPQSSSMWQFTVEKICNELKFLQVLWMLSRCILGWNLMFMNGRKGLGFGAVRVEQIFTVQEPQFFIAKHPAFEKFINCFFLLTLYFYKISQFASDYLSKCYICLAFGA